MNNQLQPNENDISRFWSHVKRGNENECWNWIAHVGSHGYGSIEIGGRNGRSLTAPRFSWLISNGEISKGMVLCHKCDNKRCVNPNHLYVGTYKDNAKDAFARRLIMIPDTRGEKNGRSKLKRIQIDQIRNLYFQGLSLTKIAKQFEVSISNVFAIVHKKTWIK